VKLSEIFALAYVVFAGDVMFTVRFVAVLAVKKRVDELNVAPTVLFA
jgi:hypothetical protein